MTLGKRQDLTPMQVRFAQRQDHEGSVAALFARLVGASGEVNWLDRGLTDRFAGHGAKGKT